MELKDAIEKRKSIRNFTDEEVPEEILRELVRRAGLAPSINNSQPWKFIAVTNGEMISNLTEAVQKKIEEMFPTDSTEEERVKNTVSSFSSFFGNAPALIVVLNSPYKAVIDEILDDKIFTHEDINRLRNHPNVQTIGAAVENILLSAVDLGYGGCWLTGLLVAREELEQIVGVEEPFKIAACVAIGKPSGSSEPKTKKSLDEIFEIRK